MSIVSRRTIGQILLAYDDGTSPPTEVLPLGSLVSVADGTLWISLGSGSYAQASGGGALGDSTVWSSRADWADLGTLPSGDIRSGDLAPISDLGGVSISYGTAIYNGGWALFSGYFQDPADLIAFIQPINTGAVVSVGAANEDGIRYYYDGGQWVRTPDATGYFWQSAPDWPTLLTTYPVDNLRSGDFCLATSLDIAYGAAYGIATWDGTTWKLFLGVFESVADMEAFAIAYSVTYGALASVYPGAVDSELSVRFFWDGLQWDRTPDGIHYVWGQVANWAALSTIIAPKNNDEVPVNYLGTHASSGTAQRHGGTWKLVEGKWATVADMNAWAGGAIHSGAIGFVDAHPHHYDEDSTVYYRVGSNWVRMAKNVPVTFTLSSLRDFSGLGLTEGDYGLYGNTVYRYKAAVSSSFDFTSDAMWLPPVVYAGSPSLRGRLVGTETIPTIPTYTATAVVGGISFSVIAPSGSATVTQSGNYIQFQTATAVGSNQIFAHSFFTTTSTTKTYMQCDIAVSYSGAGGAIARLIGSEGAGLSAFTFHLGPSGTAGIAPSPYFTTSTALQGSTEAIRNAGINWPAALSGSTYSTTELIDFGRDVAVECVRDGINYARGRRSTAGPAPAAPPGGGVGFIMQGGAGSPGGTLTFRIKNWRVLTW